MKDLEIFLKKAADRLDGEWVLLGGALLNVLKISDRATLDIDMVPLHRESNEETLALIDLAAELGLPPETINMAAGHYLKKVKNWKEELVLLSKGRKGTIYRTSATLFIELKLERLTEYDVDDVAKMLKFAKKHHEQVDMERLKQVVQKKIREKLSEEKKARYEAVLGHFESLL